MNIEKIRGKYYFDRLLSDFQNLKNSKDEKLYKYLLHLLYTYGDSIFALGRLDADELIQSIIVCSDPDSFDE